MKLIKEIKKNTIFLLLITLVVLFVIFKDSYHDIINTLASMNKVYILIAVFFFFLSIFIKSIANYIIINDDNKMSLKECFKHDLIIQFFNGITPFSTGGQPMEIYMLTEHNISGIKATNISIQNFIFYQTALVLYGLLAVLYNYIFKLFPKSPVLSKLVLLGFLINSFVAIVLLCILISKTLTKRIAHFFIELFSKIRLIKDKEKTLLNIDNKLDEFHESALMLRKRKGLFLTGIILHFLSLTFAYIIPLIIVYSINDFTSLTIMEAITCSAYVLLIGAFVPIPGASGGIEFGFLQFYGHFLSSNVISGVLIAWRFITYYLGIIIGALVFNFEKKVD